MSTEMQSMTPFDTFGEPSDQGMSQSYGQEPTKPRGLLVTIHRALRGRYWIAVPLGLVFGLIGGYFGWKSQKPLFRGDGTLMIQYQLDSPFMRDRSSASAGIPMYEEFLLTQTLVIMSRNTVSLAMQDPLWIKTGRGDDALTTKRFAESLTVEHPRQTQAIHIAFTDIDPGVAQAAVTSIINAYQKLYLAKDEYVQTSKLKVLNSHVDELKTLINAEKRAIAEIAAEYGTEDFHAIYQNKLDAVNALDKQLSDTRLQLALRKGKGDPIKTIDNFTLAQIGMLDGMMARKNEAFDIEDANVRRLESILGDRNPKVVEAKRAREAAHTAAEEYAKQYREMNKKMAEAGSDTRGNAGTRLAVSRESLEAEVTSLTEMYNKAMDEMKTVGKKLLTLNAHQEKVKETMVERRSFENEKAAVLDEGKGDGRLKVINYGDCPIVPFKDRRKSMAVAGALAGGAVPVAFFMLLGFMDKRYRYSDEADGAAGMPPLLGILPTLPDRLSDPEQAAVAAHCIHQLRIMLQVNGAQERKVYMITSASAGDGKTSLTMALGLSFAASGSRTLVVDCDMVGQGLTTRLKARNSPGLLEALGAGTLNQRVKKTTTPNLFILPIGGADSAHAGSLSPTSIRKLLAEARRIFDIVIIDTGPILGSLEAAVVGAAADSVILTIARGQHQPLVERSVRQLRQVGANIAGLVFNRAEKRDFQRSVGSSSIRSISMHPAPQRMLISEGAEESRFGPLARSVASFMPGNAMPKDRALPPVPSNQSNGGIHVDVISQQAEGELTDDGEHESLSNNGHHGEPR